MKNAKKSLSRKTSKNDPQPSFISPIFLILPEEKIIFKTNPHWLLIVVPEIGLAIFGIFTVKYLSPFIEEGLFPSWFLFFLGGALVFAMVVIFLYWICVKYYLTNLRLIEERGIIGKRIMSIWLNKVQDVTCKFGILGRIFGFGDIEIESAGTYGKIVFSYIPSPRKLQEEIEKTIYKMVYTNSLKNPL
jgi:uncharacterized membrane protein YdbT with pleckstrin-like domain